MLRVAMVLLIAAFAVTCAPIDRSVGAACHNNRDCRDRCLDDWPGGFCTLECRDDRDCPRDAVCSNVRGGVCLLLCRDNDECHDILDDNDYRCDDRSNVGGGFDDVCVPR